VASVIVAFLLYGVLSALRNGFRGSVELAGADRLMTTHKVSFIQPLPRVTWGAFRSVPGVRSVTHATWYGGIYQDNRTVCKVMRWIRNRICKCIRTSLVRRGLRTLVAERVRHHRRHESE